MLFLSDDYLERWMNNIILLRKNKRWKSQRAQNALMLFIYLFFFLQILLPLYAICNVVDPRR